LFFTGLIRGIEGKRRKREVGEWRRRKKRRRGGQRREGMREGFGIFNHRVRRRWYGFRVQDLQV
jgi:hypothetical protein